VYSLFNYKKDNKIGYLDGGKIDFLLNSDFFSDPNAKKISSLTPFEKKFSKGPTFIFWGFFLSFSSFPPFQMAGMSPCLTRVSSSQAEMM